MRKTLGIINSLPGSAVIIRDPSSFFNNLDSNCSTNVRFLKNIYWCSIVGLKYRTLQTHLNGSELTSVKMGPTHTLDDRSTRILLEGPDLREVDNFRRDTAILVTCWRESEKDKK
eukprot:NODE_963_length_2727_cov_0.218798.p3 type:complete len:115 gc:universal NODE_963_length_2727_cov_0.218798:2338-2682(+)